MQHPPSDMSAALRVGIDAALARPVLLDPRALDGVRTGASLRLRTRVFGLDGRPLGQITTREWSAGAPYALDGDVAIVAIEGPLAQRAWSCMEMFGGDGYDAIAERFAAALADEQARSVLLLIDSPGGECAGCFEAVRAMRAAASAAGKPVVAYVDEMACSAAYALASVADSIVAPPSAVVGSIGVLAVIGDRVAANEADGVNVRVVRSGPKKAVPHPDEPLTDAGVALVQLEVDTLARQFAASVAATRARSTDEILALDGATFLADEALRRGLIDRVGGRAEAFDVAREIANRIKTTPLDTSVQPAAATTKKARTMESIAKELGLAMNASESDIVVALRARSARDARIRSIAGVPADADDAKTFGALEAQREAAEKVPALEQLAAEHRAKIAADERASMLAEGKRDGKLAPAHLDAATKQGARVAAMSNAELRAFLDATVPDPRLAAGHGPKPPASRIAQIDAKAWAEMPGEAKARLLRDDPETFRACQAAYGR